MACCLNPQRNSIEAITTTNMYWMEKKRILIDSSSKGTCNRIRWASFVKRWFFTASDVASHIVISRTCTISIQKTRTSSWRKRHRMNVARKPIRNWSSRKPSRDSSFVEPWESINIPTFDQTSRSRFRMQCTLIHMLYYWQFPNRSDSLQLCTYARTMARNYTHYSTGNCAMQLLKRKRTRTAWSHGEHCWIEQATRQWWITNKHDVRCSATEVMRLCIEENIWVDSECCRCLTPFSFSVKHR